MADLWQDDKVMSKGKTMKEELKIKYLPIKQLKINPVNPRQITEEKYKSLVKSLEDCPSLFDARPCLCSDRTGELIVLGGNMRLRAAKELGYEQVPVIVLSNLSEDQEKEITIKDNGSWGSWGMDLLSGWDDLPLIDWGVDLPGDWIMNIDPIEEDTGNEDQIETIVPDDIIMECINSADKIIYQFSGGRDSTLAILKTLELVRDKNPTAYYVDTGTEFPDLLYFIYNFCEKNNLPLEVLHPKHNFFELYGKKKVFPNPVFRNCIQPLINDPLDEVISVGENVLVVRGGRSKQKTSKSKSNITNTFERKNKIIKLLNPLFLLSDEDYVEDISKVTIWPGYDKGFVRTACWCCPFQNQEQWEALKINYPLLWDNMKIMVQTWEFIKVKGDGYIKRFMTYWNNQ